MGQVLELYRAFQREEAAGGAACGSAHSAHRHATLSPLRYVDLAALPSTACVVDALLADLEGLQQNQVRVLYCHPRCVCARV